MALEIQTHANGFIKYLYRNARVIQRCTNNNHIPGNIYVQCIHIFNHILFISHALYLEFRFPYHNYSHLTFWQSYIIPRILQYLRLYISCHNSSTSFISSIRASYCSYIPTYIYIYPHTYTKSSYNINHKYLIFTYTFIITIHTYAHFSYFIIFIYPFDTMIPM